MSGARERSWNPLLSASKVTRKLVSPVSQCSHDLTSAQEHVCAPGSSWSGYLCRAAVIYCTVTTQEVDRPGEVDRPPFPGLYMFSSHPNCIHTLLDYKFISLNSFAAFRIGWTKKFEFYAE
jgi:hypothetical protein